MAFTKFIYNLINWKNKSESLTTPLGATNLNKMDSAIKKINDNLNSAYDEISSEKLDKSTAYTMVKDVTYNSGTGVFTVTKLNGTTLTIDTKLEKIVTNWKYDKDSQKLILTLDDGTTQEVDLSALITQYEFKDSDTIAFTVESDGSVTANVKDGSITDKKIQPNYLADITTQASNAETSAQNASDYADDASYDAKLAQSYAIGGSGIRDGEETNNAKYYSEQANKEANNASGFAESASAFAENANRNASYASSYANTASNHASNASASAESASEYAESANQSANEANGHAESASSFAETANRYSNYASGYANTASTHASNASASAQSASDSASAAEESAKNAKAEADKIVEIAGGDFVLQSEKGEANGVAPLDENALIPLEYVPDNPLLKDNASKNLLEVTATSQTINGVTFTVNDDGSVTANGTATASANFELKKGIVLETGQKYTISGCPSDGGGTLYKVYLLESTSWKNNAEDSGQGANVTAREGNVFMARISVFSGATVDNVTFYPMIRRAEIADDTYEPYYASNKELTEIVKEGSVNSADKLTTPRKINGVDFDGSKDITVSDRKYCFVGSNSANSAGWYKFASGTLSNNDNINVMLGLTSNYIQYFSGILTFQARCENNTFTVWKMSWHTRIGFNADDVMCVVDGMSYTLYVKLRTSQYGRIMIERLMESTRAIADASAYITLHNNDVVESTEPVATVTSSDGATVQSANQLSEARMIGKASFDGTSGIALANIMGTAYASTSGTDYVKKYTPIARIDVSDAAYSRCEGLLEFTNNGGHANGLLNFHVRSGSTISSSTIYLNWLHLQPLLYENSIIAVKVEDGIFDLYFQPQSTWANGEFTLINCTTPYKIELLSKQGYVDTITSFKISSLSGYVAQANQLYIKQLSSENIDDLLTAGLEYWAGNGNSCTGDIPSGTVAFNLKVFKNAGNYLFQRLINQNGTIFTRAYMGGTWTDWSEIARTNSNVASATKAEQDGNGKVIADTYATFSALNSASQNLNNLINQLDLNKASIHTKTTTSTGSASFTVKVGSIIFITTGQATSTGNHLMIAQVRSEGVLSDIYKSSTSAAISLSLSALTLSVGIGSSNGATITVLS